MASATSAFSVGCLAAINYGLADEELELTGLGHRIPRQAIERDAFELAIHSTTFVPAEVGDSADRRSLGVMVTDVTVHCWGL